MPFTSIQSSFRRSAIVPLQAYRITNWLYDDVNNDTVNYNYGFAEISDDGKTMVVGGLSTAKIYTREGGAETPWSLSQELSPSTSPTTTAQYGAMDVCISGDGTRVAFGSVERDGELAIYVFSRTGGSPEWTQEQRLVVVSSPSFLGTPAHVSFNTSSDVHEVLLYGQYLDDYITLTIPPEDWSYTDWPMIPVKYSKNGGTANAGLVDNQIYWLYAYTPSHTTVFNERPSVPNPGGVWSESTSYFVGDMIYAEGYWHRCKENNPAPSVGPVGGDFYWEASSTVVNLTSTGNETHRFYMSAPVYINIRTFDSNIDLPSLRMDYNGSTLVTNKYAAYGDLATLTVFARGGSPTWDVQQTIPIRSTHATETYDTHTWTTAGSLAISNDGDTIACGKAGNAVYEVDIFKRVANVWSLDQTIAAP